MNKKPGFLRRLAGIGARMLGKLAGGSTRSVFKGAELSRLWWDWVASPISADQELYNDFMRLRSRAREMRRNVPLIRKYLKLLSNNVVGPNGFTLRARVRNADGGLNRMLNKKIEAAWFKWSKSVTVDGLFGLVEIQQQLIKSLATDGEVCIRRIRSYKDNLFRYALQVIDPDLLDHQFFRSPGADGNQNEIRLGVEINEYGKPLAYWFWDRHPTDLINIGARKRIRVPAEELTHLFIPDRSMQSRGYTWLNTVMMPAKMLDGYIEAEVVAARIGSSKMGFFQSKTAADYEPPPTDATDPRGKIEMEATPGSFEELPPGYEFKEWNPEHPAVAFPNFLKALQRWIAAGLGVGYNALADDLEGVNYSSIRSAMLIERDEWRALQGWWSRRFLEPIYAEWLEYAELSGQLVLDARPWSAFLEVLFTPRGWDWVDPLKDVNASVAEIDNGLNSRQRVCAEQGVDFEDIAEELCEEQTIIKEYGLELTGLGVAAGAVAADTGETAADKEDAQSSGGSGRAANAAIIRRHARNHIRLRLVSSLAANEE
jgi:lambda family phage portal protein